MDSITTSKRSNPLTWREILPVTADDIRIISEKMHWIAFTIGSGILLPNAPALPPDKAQFLTAILWHAARAHLLAVFDGDALTQSDPLTDEEIDLIEAVAAMAEARLKRRAA